MNSVVEEMKAILEGGDELKHYGMPRRSGRYPWGSGEDGYQRTRDFLGRYDELKRQGKSEVEIAKEMNILDEYGKPSTGRLRIQKAVAKDERRTLDVNKAKSLKDKGFTPTQIGKEMGVNESTVRSWLNQESEARMKQARETANFIKSQVDKNGGQMVDVGTGVERELNISSEKLKQALYLLEMDGYKIYKGGIPQATNPGQQTNQKVICPPGTEHKEIYNFDKIHPLNEDQYISRDNGNTFEKKFTYPESMDSKRLKIRYAEEGGTDKDGVIELRRGVDDLSLGESRYSQVRILVDGTHYLKGMAVYSDDMPDGVDVVFNTNKKQGTPALGPKDNTVLKLIKKDPDNPFGSLIKDANQGGQYWYEDKSGKKKLGLINKRADEGDWDEWADALPSQFLGKQNLPMIKKQLNIAKADKIAEYEEICSLTNPTIKKHMLNKFADECDSAAVHLKAAALPGQKYHVIIPNNTLKETEIYAPGYESGTKLALVRYPHGGTFEIPICTVNNKNALGKKLIGTTPIDAVCINAKVAERLSGADFDGDTVMCIPTHDSKGRVKISNKDPLKDLEGFDPKTDYGPDSYAGRTIKHMRNTQTEMGKISNLITDMTILGADDKELARAVKHSMVVIDAEKHNLDYKRSEIDNNIAALKKEYQNGGGASTILSRAKGEVSVDKRQGMPKVNMKYNKKGEINDFYDPSRPEGALVYKKADDLYYDVTKVNKKTGEVTVQTKKRTQQSTRMAETDDAYSLVSESKNAKEMAYAEYANNMKALANRARKEMMNTGKIEYNKNAKAIYQKEVDSLETKLNDALLNTSRERAAQRRANAEVTTKVKAVMEANPGMTRREAEKAVDVKKTGTQALTKYRDEVGSVSRRDRSIKITDREWEAIQAGAISETKLKQILNNTDIDVLREKATPRATTNLSSAKINRIKAYSASNYSIAEIAKKLGVSTSTVSKYLKGA